MSTYTAILDLVIDASENGAIITAETYPGLSDPTNYNVIIIREFDQYQSEIQNFNTSSQPITVSNLLSGTSYKAVVIPSLNGEFDPRGRWEKRFSTLSSYGGQTVSSTRQDFKVSKSYLQLAVTQTQYKNKQSAIFHRSFDSITVPTTKTVSATNGNSYNAGYFSFGTSLIMKDTLENTLHAGGIGFFLNE